MKITCIVQCLENALYMHYNQASLHTPPRLQHRQSSCPGSCLQVSTQQHAGPAALTSCGKCCIASICMHHADCCPAACRMTQSQVAPEAPGLSTSNPAAGCINRGLRIPVQPHTSELGYTATDVWCRGCRSTTSRLRCHAAGCAFHAVCAIIVDLTCMDVRACMRNTYLVPC